MDRLFLVVDVMGRVIYEALTLEEAQAVASSERLAAHIADELGAILADVTTAEARAYGERYRAEMLRLDRPSEAA